MLIDTLQVHSPVSKLRSVVRRVLANFQSEEMGSEEYQTFENETKTESKPEAPPPPLVLLFVAPAPLASRDFSSSMAASLVAMISLSSDIRDSIC